MVKVTVDRGRNQRVYRRFCDFKSNERKGGQCTADNYSKIGEAWPEEIIESMMKSEKVLLIKEFTKEHYPGRPRECIRPIWKKKQEMTC